MISSKNKKDKSLTGRLQQIVAILYKYQIPYIIFGLLGAYGLISTVQLYGLGEDTMYHSEFIIFLTAVPIVLLYKKVKQYNYHLASLVFSFILSLILIIGAQLDFTSDISWSFQTLITIVTFAFFLYPISSFAINHFMAIKIPKKKLIITRQHKLIIFSVIFIFNIIVWLALFPGIYDYDSINQVKQFINGNISTHFSVSFSFILYCFLNLGNALLGSYSAGLAIYIFLQIIFLSYIFTRIVIFTAKTINAKLALICSTLFFTLNLFIQIICSWDCQDAIFGGIFALIFINLVEIYRQPDQYFHKKSNLIKLPVLIFLLCITRNNGFYVVLLVAITAIVLLKGNRLISTIVFITPLIVFQLYFNLFLPALGVTIAKGDALREMSSIPSQQLARTYVYRPDVFSDEQIQALKRYYDYVDDKFEYYTVDPSISDNRKRLLNYQEVQSNPLGYVELWASVGLKAPGNYIEAALLTNLGYWYPNKQYYDSRMYHPVIEYTNAEEQVAIKESSISVNQTPAFQLYRRFIGWLLNREENNWQKIPLIRTLYTPGFYFIVFLFALFIVCLRKNYKLLLPLSLVCGLYITLFLSPVSLFRYAFPIVIVAPAIFSMVFITTRNKKNAKAKVSHR